MWMLTSCLSTRLQPQLFLIEILILQRWSKRNLKNDQQRIYVDTMMKNGGKSIIANGKLWMIEPVQDELEI